MGKSTLLFKMIKPYIDCFGGFCVQRLLKDCRCVAFALRDIEEISNPILVNHYEKNDKDIFIDKTDGGFKMKLAVFEEKGLAILQKAQTSNKKIIFLDEIGGVELFLSVFKRETLKLLEGEKPCLGVLKFKEDVCFWARKSHQLGII
ncbi:hypothetical protein AZF37_09175 [endosymbiont 'TC1' of Trimyema compressum]|nr:hypothetical protein AZF37_09175 [endosymbiont 'TC1' of Trimyema compressum]